MTQQSIRNLIFGSLLSVFAVGIQAQEPAGLNQWFAEDHSGNMQINVSGDTLNITAPKGLTLWYKERLTGAYEISYHVKVLMQGGKHDRLSDLNCFWGANDPQHPDNLFARNQYRKGIFANYKTLNLFYVGYGGNHNSTTRFRQYFGGISERDDSIARPVIKEYTDRQHLLFPNQWYHIRIEVKKGSTSFYVNDEKLFHYTLKEKEGDGNFGLRLLSNHVLFTKFQIRNLHTQTSTQKNATE